MKNLRFFFLLLICLSAKSVVFDCYGYFSNETEWVCSGHGNCIGEDLCDCNSTFVGFECNVTTCFGEYSNSSTVCSSHGYCVDYEKCECWGDHEGPNCELFKCGQFYQNDTNVCSNRGNCTSPSTCVCPLDIEGDICEYHFCNGIRNDNESVCLGFGNCTDVNFCTCPLFREGLDCQYFFCGTFRNDDYAQVCSNHGDCDAPQNCSCDFPYYGPQCAEWDCGSFNKDDPSTCNSRGFCVSPNNCTCNDTYYGNDCEYFDCGIYRHDDINVCSNHGSCIHPQNCSCASGYYGNECSHFDCNFFHKNDPQSCHSRGICISPNNCSCNATYYGSDCEDFNCFTFHKDSPNVCNERGICIDSNKCICNNTYGYGGIECADPFCFNILSLNDSVCHGHGNCSVPNYCSCDNNYGDLECNIRKCYGILSNNESAVCNSHGICMDDFTCSCNTSYHGLSCDIYECYGVLSNDSMQCSSHGECIDYQICKCDNIEEYSGSNCEYPKCYGKYSNEINVCNGKGNCTNPNECICNDKYKGDICEIPICNGYEQNDTMVCNGHGSCLYNLTCFCNDNYDGYDCEINYCNGIPSTSINQCSGHGNCTAYEVCNCHHDYTGDNCEHPICFGVTFESNNQCNGNGTCTNVNECTCNVGYDLYDCSMHKCNDILATNKTVCSGHGDCIDVNICKCRNKYDGTTEDGNDCAFANCFDVFENENQVCSGFGNCTDTDTCSCDPLYYGINCHVTHCVSTFTNDTTMCDGNGRCNLDQPNVCTCNLFRAGIECDTDVTSILLISGIVGVSVVLLIIIIIFVTIVGLFLTRRFIIDNKAREYINLIKRNLELEDDPDFLERFKDPSKVSLIQMKELREKAQVYVDLEREISAQEDQIQSSESWKRNWKVKTYAELEVQPILESPFHILLIENNYAYKMELSKSLNSETPTMDSENYKLISAVFNVKTNQLKKLKHVKIPGRRDRKNLLKYKGSYNFWNVFIKSYEVKKDVTEEAVMQLCEFIQSYQGYIHPNLIRIMGTSFHSERICFVFDYCKYGDLQKFLTENKTVPVNIRLKFLLEVVRAMEYLEKKKKYLGYLNCSNIAIDDTLHAKVPLFCTSSIPFKIRKNLFVKIQDPKDNVYTYLPPETVMGEPSGIKGDVYSFALMMYCVLSGNFNPWNDLPKGEHLVEANKHEDYRPKLDRIKISWARDLIIRCWQQNEKQRPSFRDIHLEFLKHVPIKDLDILDEMEYKTMLIKRESFVGDELLKEQDVGNSIKKLNEEDEERLEQKRELEKKLKAERERDESDRLEKAKQRMQRKRKKKKSFIGFLKKSSSKDNIITPLEPMNSPIFTDLKLYEVVKDIKNEEAVEMVRWIPLIDIGEDELNAIEKSFEESDFNFGVDDSGRFKFYKEFKSFGIIPKVEYEDLKILKYVTTRTGKSGATCYLCFHNGNMVSLKSYPTKYIESSWKDMKQYLSVLKTLEDFTYIGKTLGILLQPTRIGLISEYHKFSNIRSFFDVNPKLPMHERYRMAYELIMALKYLHSLDILHLNLCPENVLLNDNLTVKVVDFGIANIISKMSSSVTKMDSSFTYIAPETYTAGIKNSTKKSDVWVASMIIFGILTNNFNPYDDTPKEIKSQKAFTDSSVRPNVKDLEHDWVKKILIKCWSLEDDERPSFDEIEVIFEENLTKMKVFELNEDFNKLFKKQLMKSTLNMGMNTGKNENDNDDDESTEYEFSPSPMDFEMIDKKKKEIEAQLKKRLINKKTKNKKTKKEVEEEEEEEIIKKDNSKIILFGDMNMNGKRTMLGVPFINITGDPFDVILLSEDKFQTKLYRKLSQKIDTGDDDFDIFKRVFNVLRDDLRITGGLGVSKKFHRRGIEFYVGNYKKKIVCLKLFGTKVNITKEDMVHFAKELDKTYMNLMDIYLKKHPNILMVYGSILHVERIGFILGYCKYGNLFEYLHNHPWIAHARRVHIGFGIARALKQICFDKKLRIKDLRMSSFLIDDKQIPKFNPMSIMSFSTRSRNKVISSRLPPEYKEFFISPESLDNISDKDYEKCSVYTFAIILYMIITNVKDPYQTCHLYRSNILDIKNPKYRPNMNLIRVKWIKDLITMCLLESPNKRPSFKKIVNIFMYNMKFSKQEKEDIIDIENLSEANKITLNVRDASELGEKGAVKLTLSDISLKGIKEIIYRKWGNEKKIESICVEVKDDFEFLDVDQDVEKLKDNSTIVVEFKK